MKKGLSVVIFCAVLVVSSCFVSAGWFDWFNENGGTISGKVVFEDPNNEQVFKEYMIWDLPEISDYNLFGTGESQVDNYRRISIRYSPQGEGQHSE